MTEAEREFYAGFRPVEPGPPRAPTAPLRARDLPFEQALSEFLAAWEIKRDANPAGQGPVQLLRFPTSPFLKVAVQGSGVRAFIALQDGENRTLGHFWQGQVFYPSGWHSPAAHARGSIFDDPPARCMDWHGPHRLR